MKKFLEKVKTLKKRVAEQDLPFLEETIERFEKHSKYLPHNQFVTITTIAPEIGFARQYNLVKCLGFDFKNITLTQFYNRIRDYQRTIISTYAFHVYKLMNRPDILPYITPEVAYMLDCDIKDSNFNWIKIRRTSKALKDKEEGCVIGNVNHYYVLERNAFSITAPYIVVPNNDDLSNQLSYELLRSAAKEAKQNVLQELKIGDGLFSDRLMEVANLRAIGKNANEIAANMELKTDTIKEYSKRINRRMSDIFKRKFTDCNEACLFLKQLRFLDGESSDLSKIC